MPIGETLNAAFGGSAVHGRQGRDGVRCVACQLFWFTHADGAEDTVYLAEDTHPDLQLGIASACFLPSGPMSRRVAALASGEGGRKWGARRQSAAGMLGCANDLKEVCQGGEVVVRKLELEVVLGQSKFLSGGFLLLGTRGWNEVGCCRVGCEQLRSKST